MDKTIEKKFITGSKIIKLAGILLVIAIIIYILIGQDGLSRLNVDTERITIAEVHEGKFLYYFPLTATVIPIRTYFLDAMEGGRVEKIIRDAGSLVEQGDTILILANTNLLLDIMNREAQLFEQRNNLRNTRLAMEQHSLKLEADMVHLNWEIKNAERTHKNNEALMERDLISRVTYEETRDRYEYLMVSRELTRKTQVQDSLFRSLQIEMLEASVKRIQNNLDMVRQNLENLCLRAPVAGRLTSLNAEIGESKSRGERFGQIDILEGFKVQADVEEHYISRLDIGQAGEFDLNGETYDLEVSKIYPEVQNGLFKIDMEFTGKVPDIIRRGQSVRVKLALEDLANALLLPRGAFYQATGGNWAYVVDPSGEFALKREIRLGRKNPELFEVIEGLEPGEKVIISGYDSFGEIEKLILND